MRFHFSHVVGAILFLIFLCSASLFAQNGWYYQLPQPTDNQLNDVCFSDSLTATVVGDNGVLFRTTDGGATWRQQQSGVDQALFGVAFLNANTGIAVGDYAVITRTTNGGLSWISQNVIDLGAFYGIAFADAQDVYAVGSGGLIAVSRDGGQTWVNQLSRTGAQLNGVAFSDANNGCAVGSGIILVTVNGGHTWDTLFNAGDTMFYSVSFIDPNTICAVGDAGVIFHRANGAAAWNKTSISAHGTSVSFCDSLNGFIVENSAVYHTTDGGATWNTESLQTQESAIACATPEKAMAVGLWGQISRTGNGGTTWALVSGSLFTPVFSSIALASAQKGVAVGNNAILITSDSGSHWAIDTTLNGTVVLNSVTYADSNTTVAVGNSGVIYRATNGGRTWSAVPSGLTTDLFGVRFANANTGYAVGGYYVSHGINKPSTPYRTVLKTTNGGSTWSTVHSDSGNVLSAVWCIDAQTLFAAGRTDSGWSESIIYSTNGGSTWKTVSDTTQGYDLLSIAFFNADTGLAVGLGGIVLRTTNGGMLWRSVQSGTEAFLYSVAAVQNSSIAAASGSNGTIIFTQDAGATWRNQVSGTSAHLYGIAFADSNIANTAGGTEQDIGEPHGVILRNNHADAPLPRFAKSPAGLNFGNVLLGYQHEDSVIVTNTGASDLYITFDLPTDPTFSVRPGTQIIPPGQPRIFYVTFAPVDTQTRHAYIIFINNATNTGDSVALTGKGYGGSVFASGFGVDFGNVRLGTTARDSVTIYNRGDLPLSLSSITMTDPRFAADETNGTIPPGDSMILHVAYTPTGPNGNGGFAIIKNNSVTSPDSIGFTGTGFTSPLISGDTLNFGRVPLGEYELMRFTLVNNSLLYLNLDSIVSTNPYFVPAPPYKTVYSGQSMVTPVTFTPDSVRSYNGYVIIHYQGVNAPDTIVVLGEGTGPFIAFNKRTLNFGEVLPGNTKTDSVWIHNRGDTTLHISFIYPTESVFTVPVQSMTILPGDSTALQVSFSPLLQQEYSAYLLITSNAASSPDTVVLIGSPASNIRTEPVFPDLYALDQNYPNPFTNTTFFRFSLPQPSNVRMTIDNIFGHTVATLANKQFSGGDHIVAFTANELPAGTYFCNIQAGTWSASRMITLIQ